MTSDEFKKMTNEELLRRIYTTQLRMQMDIEKIALNVIRLRQKVEPEAFEQDAINKENPSGWRHLKEINKDMESMFTEFQRQLEIFDK